jgi:predicted restriction endonuclease
VPWRPCVRCGTLIQAGSYCARHEPVRRTRTTPGRGSGAAIMRFREAVLARDGYQCRAVENGKRCDITDPRQLHAHHIVPLRSGGTNAPENGVCLCRKHHRAVEARTLATAP